MRPAERRDAMVLLVSEPRTGPDLRDAGPTVLRMVVGAQLRRVIERTLTQAANGTSTAR